MPRTPRLPSETELQIFRKDLVLPYPSRRAAERQRAVFNKKRKAAEAYGIGDLRERELRVRPAEGLERRIYGEDGWVIESTDTRRSLAEALAAAKRLQDMKAAEEEKRKKEEKKEVGVEGALEELKRRAREEIGRL